MRELAQKGSPLTLIEVCGGTFSMSSESGEEDEKSLHPVILDSFWIAETKVTNAEYAKYMDDWPERDERPATGLQWKESKDYCVKYDYRLPTEAELEYAALGDYAWFYEISGTKMHPVKTKKPNPLGIYDLHGNAWEWVEDCYDAKFYGEQPKEKPTLSPVNQSTGCGLRGLRGGSAWDEPWFLRSAYRNWVNPVFRVEVSGFRCVRSLAASD